RSRRDRRIRPTPHAGTASRLARAGRFDRDSARHAGVLMTANGLVAIGFDFAHTLGVDHALERAAFFKLAEELGQPIAADDVAHKAQVDTLLADFRVGTITLDDAVKRFVASMHDVHVTDRDDTQWFREICYGLIPSHVQPLPGV